MKGEYLLLLSDMKRYKQKMSSLIDYIIIIQGGIYVLGENYILKDKNYLTIILFIFIMLSFQNWHFGSLTNQNQELIDLNKEVLSSYKRRTYTRKSYLFASIQNYICF